VLLLSLVDEALLLYILYALYAKSTQYVHPTLDFPKMPRTVLPVCIGYRKAFAGVGSTI
jgi:hypothetical protein